MAYARLSMSDFLKILNRAQINLKHIEVIAEIGALDGSDSLELKKNVPHAFCYLIEGLKKNYETHLKDLKNVMTFNLVIANFNGTINYYEKEDQGIHGIFRSHWSKTKEVQRVPCSRFDTFIINHSLPCPDLVKIDTEGASYEVLIGFGEILRKVKIIQLETETLPLFPGQKLQHEVYGLLRGFQFENIYEMKCCEGQYDAIFINTDYKKWLCSN